MRLYFCQEFLFISSINILLSKDNRVSAKDDEVSAKSSVFSDVINNITRVNNVLENLITDYEKLKKIYESEETFENDSLSETEIGAIGNSNKEHRSKKKTKKPKKTQKTTKTTGQYATQMFIYSYGSENESYEETEPKEEENIKEIKRESINESHKGKPKKIQRESKIKSIKEKRKKRKRTPKIESVKEVAKAKKEPKKPVKENVNELKREPKVEYLKEKNNEVTNISDNETEYYDSSSNEGDSTVETNTLTLDEPPQKEEKVEEPVTYTIKRYELDNNQPNGEIKRIRDHSIKVSLVNGSKPVWKIVRSEDFSNKNIWNDIVQNKPVHLKKEIVLRTNDITVESIESLENNQTMEKELFKTRILRKAYGDACLKVVIKKCYKACKRVASICKIHGCKGSFQSTFKHNAKTGCIHVFKPPAHVSPDPAFPDPPNPGFNESIWFGNERRADTDSFDSVFYDVTNNGYLAAVCLPDRRSTKNLPQNQLGKEYKILRDRFERACQRTSSKKCIKACTYSVDQTCATKKCPKKLRNALKTGCKRECKNSYGVSSSSDKESSTSSETSSSSDSTDSSDSDSKEKKKLVGKDDAKEKKLNETSTTKKKKEKKKKKKKKDEEENDDEESDEEEEEDEKGNKKKKGKKEEKKNKPKEGKKKRAHKRKHTKKKNNKTKEKTEESTDEDPTL